MGLPYFPMFPSDFEAKTSHLTLEEDGAYNRLLRLMWMTPGCSLPDDDAWIMRRMRVDADTYERVVRIVIDEFCIRSNGRVSNAKLTEVFDESKSRHEKRVSAGSKGGKAKALKTNKTEPSNAQAMLKQPKPKPKPYNNPPTPQGDLFDDFWSVVPKKVGKGQARKAWKAALKKADAEAIISAMKRYAASRKGQDDQFTAHPSTWLNGERWADDVGGSVGGEISQEAIQALRDGLKSDVPAVREHSERRLKQLREEEKI
jgi:uncharacterized protein YdaU (DUF1376 family)